MHNLFLGLIQEHFQGILGIRLAKVSAADTRPVLDITFSDHTGNNLNDAEWKSLSKALSWLTGPMNQELASELGRAKWIKKLSSLHLEALKFLCQELHCAPIAVDPCKRMMNRPDYARGILIWVSMHPFQCQFLPTFFFSVRTSSRKTTILWDTQQHPQSVAMSLLRRK
jgi:hypothetical protein